MIVEEGSGGDSDRATTSAATVSISSRPEARPEGPAQNEEKTVLEADDTFELPTDEARPSGTDRARGPRGAAAGARTTRSSRGAEPDPVELGEVVGRYVVLSKLGAGGMGVVLAAYDPRLDRKVALKLLKTRRDHHSARERLEREAKALARLDHRNVVSVYDVGVHEGQLFVAMEFVAGRTLGQWMRAVETPRPWSEVLAVFMAAGRGLAAAHEVGMVHRDFKPDNVMVGDDGRVRVMDFGLARAGLGDENEGEGSPGAPVPLGRLTQTGAIMGTPAYMAHEQFEAKEVDARSDQFSFCVALFEALYGERPFGGSSFLQLMKAVEAEEIRAPPTGSEVPAWLRAVVVRGLVRDPDRRWPSMEALLEALADDPALRRRKWIALGGGVGLLLAAVVLGWALAPEREMQLETCESFVAQLDEHWDSARARKLRERVSQVDESSAAYVNDELARLAGSWQATAAERCRGELAPAVDSRARECMEAWLVNFDRVAATLERADLEQLHHAPNLLARLDPVAGDYCALQPHPEVDAAIAEQAQIARELAALGDFKGARAEAEAVVEAASELAGEQRYTFEQAEAHAALGQVLAFATDETRALEELKLAQAHARSTAYHELDLDILLLRVKLAALIGDLELSATLLEQVDPLVELARIGPESARAAEIHEAWGHHERARGETQLAIEHHRRSRALFEAAGQPLAAAKTLINIGACHQEAGEPEEARHSYEEARQLFEVAGVQPSQRNYVEVDYSLAILAYNDNDEAGFEHLDAVVRHGSAERRLQALAMGISLAEALDDHERAVAWAERAVAELEHASEAPPEVRLNAELAAGYVLGAQDVMRGLRLMLAAERDAEQLGFRHRVDVKKTFFAWLVEQGRCDEAREQLDQLDRLVGESEAEAPESAGELEDWLDAARTEPCDDSPNQSVPN